LLLLLAAGTPVVAEQLNTVQLQASGSAYAQEAGGTQTPITIPTVVIPKGTAISIPTVAVPQSTPIEIPTLQIPRATATATRTAVPRTKPHPASRQPAAKARHPQGQWIWAFLTSYCPGSAGFISSSGLPVFYGMLANDFYPFGTHVYIPVLGITGVVEDRLGSFSSWNHFDVWSPSCYGTPTGYFKVAVRTK